jgi:hypothetical protein
VRTPHTANAALAETRSGVRKSDQAGGLIESILSQGRAFPQSRNFFDVGIDARTIASILGGDLTSKDSVKVPGPGHSPRDRSLSIRVDPNAPDGFVVHSFAGDDAIACRDYVRDRLGLSKWKPGEPNPFTTFRPKPKTAPETTNFGQVALRIWKESVDPRGTLSEKYLRQHRGLDLPDDVAGEVARFHPRLSFNGGFAPALITLFRDVRTNAPAAIQRTFLDKEARKLERKMLGSVRDAAIKISADENVTQGLCIGEGFETCLAARVLGYSPVWAVGSAGAIASFPVLPGIDTLTILGERGDNGANERAARECGERWTAEGREVEIVLPMVGNDFNDAVQGVE